MDRGQLMHVAQIYFHQRFDIFLPRGVNTLHMSPARRALEKKERLPTSMNLCFVGETMLVLGSGVVIQVQMTISDKHALQVR